MLRSLWSGVSGMQAHQTALDVEGHNIANVNTVGFKYSRANFSEMLSQINRIATAPYGGLGGQNDYSVGLGTGINSTTKIFSQGSIQDTENKTDLALGGDGFFIVSGDLGRTHAYTRDGGFGFDAVGNLTTNAGYIVQGWMREIDVTGESCIDESLYNVVDTTVPIKNIKIDPKLVIPAKATTEVNIDAKLTTGDKTTKFECTHALDSSSVSASDGLIPRYDSMGKRMQMAEDVGTLLDASGNAFRLTEGQGIWVSYDVSQVRKPVNNVAAASRLVINGTAITFANDSNVTGISSLVAAQNAINAKTHETGVEAYADNGQLKIVNENTLDGDASKKNIIITGAGTGVFANFSNADNKTTAYRYSYTKARDADSVTRQFRTTEELRALLQQDANNIKHGGNAYNDVTGANATVKVTVNRGGMFEILNQDDGDGNQRNLSITVSGYHDSKVTSNVLFKNTMKGMNTGILVEGGASTTSGGLMAPQIASTIDVIDSLGNKHTLTVSFRRTGNREWSFNLKVAEPATIINGSAERPNIIEGGRVTFGDRGEIVGMNPSTIQFLPNNGARGPQRLKLEFGASGKFNGLTSTDEESDVRNIGQNGFQSGTLQDYRFDSNGVLIGEFNNGRSLALAQVAIATFTNNAGLQARGSNLFSRTANSGDPAVGVANVGGRGSIKASALEMSNADLSRSLTQLIVVQRGFQANSKTVTTSDQILNALLQLKQ